MQGKLDIPDAGVSPFFMLSSAIALGLVSFSLAGFGFASTALKFSSSGFTTTTSYATIMLIIALGTAYGTKRRDLSHTGSIMLWVVFVTVAIVIIPPFVPILQTVLCNKIAGLVAAVIQASDYYSLSHTG